MPSGFEVVDTYTDEVTGITVEKQRRRRKGHGNDIRHIVKVTEDKFIYLGNTELFKMVDTLDDLCDMIADGEF